MIVDKMIAKGKIQEVKKQRKKKQKPSTLDLIYHVLDDSPRMCHGNGHSLPCTCLAWIELEV